MAPTTRSEMGQKESPQGSGEDAAADAVVREAAHEQLQPADLASMMRQMTAMFAEIIRTLGSAPVAPAAAPVASGSRPRLNVEVPSYSGYGDAKSVYAFLQQLDSYRTALGASEEDVLRQVLPVALVGTAERWRRCQPAFTSMADFKDRFRAEFLPPDYEHRMRDELALRTQHPEESLLEYVRAMQELYERADPAAADADKVARACRQCHPRFRPHLRGRSFPNLEALAQEARIVQADLLAELRYRLPPRPGESLEPGCAWSGAPVPSAHQAERMTVRQETAVGNSATLRALDPYSYKGAVRGWKTADRPLGKTTAFEDKGERMAATQTPLKETTRA
ncbi:uncharacterized protein LOC144158085 [Haemaphysalis longicornis]